MSCNPTIESASSAQDDSDGLAPAFKKAKFAWQIKGKGRSVPKDSVASTSTLLDSERVPWTAAASEQHEHDAEKEQEEEDEEEEVKSCRDQSGSDDVVNVVELQRKADEFHGMVDLSHFPFDSIPSLVRTDANVQPASRFPAHMVAQCLEQFLTSLNRTNYSLRKWQTKQLAKGIIDNAINKVLEDMGFSPFSEEEECSEPPVSINPRNIEAEGVSEAIRQRGLGRSCCHSGLEAKALDSFTSAPDSATSNKCVLHPDESCVHGVSGTSWHYCRMSVSSGIKGLLEHAPCSLCCIKHQMVDNLTCVEKNDEQQEALLNAAVTFAIGEKGLQLFSDMQEIT